MPHPATDTLLVTVSGDDRPGVTSSLFDAIADVGAEVLDLEQVVVRGHLTLALLLAAGPGNSRLRDVVISVGTELGLHVSVESGRGDNPVRRGGRAVVVVLGAPLLASAVAAVSARIAAHGANIDRIRRLSRYPVTTVELDVSGADIAALRIELSLEAAVRGVDIAVSPAGLATSTSPRACALGYPCSPGFRRVSWTRCAPISGSPLVPGPWCAR